MGLFNISQINKINEAAQRSKQLVTPVSSSRPKTSQTELNRISLEVKSYFKDSNAELVTTQEQLHQYISDIIEYGYAGIDTETTGLDRRSDTIVGASLYVPGRNECYIPMKHLVPVFDTPYANQLPYEIVAEEFDRMGEGKVKLIFANADFDLAMMYRNLKVDLCSNFFYDVILAWRCLKEDELRNGLKELYHKYVLKGEGDPKRFTDFFSPKQFPYSKPEVAMLYAANDAKITFELFLWQLPFTLKDNPKCINNHLEAISDIIWNIEFPLVAVCQKMHRTGVYFDDAIANVLKQRYHGKYDDAVSVLQQMVQEILDNNTRPLPAKKWITSGSQFNPDSTPQVKYLCKDLLGVIDEKSGTGKEILRDINLPVTNQILEVRSISTLIGTFVDKLPMSKWEDNRIHASFRQLGASTGRLSSESPNVQNIPSHAEDIRHVFRATPGYVLLSSDYSGQEPKVCAFLANDAQMIGAFQAGRDIYASIASVAFNQPYEKCLEFHPDTGEYQPDGKARRSEAKVILLGTLYGRSIPSIADQLYGTRDDMSDDDKIKGAQRVYDSVMNAFPGLRDFMFASQTFAKKYGYVETILGRRRHIPDMQLPEFEFRALSGYVNPDIDPLDPATLTSKSEIPDRIVKQLTAEFKRYKYWGQIVKRTKQLYEEDHIKVINNRSKIQDASRKTVNSRVQGSAADLTKMAMLALDKDPEWNEIGGRLLIPVHDELICEVPIEHWKRGGEILSRVMCDAANFLPFPMKCDVTTSIRWYGLEYPCPYPKPVKLNLNDMSSEEIKWIQYYLVENEYILPVYPDENGDKPRGDAARGVNGVWSDEVNDAVNDFMTKHGISDYSDFIDAVERVATYGE